MALRDHGAWIVFRPRASDGLAGPRRKGIVPVFKPEQLLFLCADGSAWFAFAGRSRRFGLCPLPVAAERRSPTRGRTRSGIRILAFYGRPMDFSARDSCDPYMSGSRRKM